MKFCLTFWVQFLYLLCDDLENSREAGTTEAVGWREVGAARDRFQVWRQEDAHRPPTATRYGLNSVGRTLTAHHFVYLDEAHVEFVDVRSFFPERIIR